MQNIKLMIAYDGSRYYGWQRLGNTDQTIQGKIENVLSKMLNENIELIGSGRTDGGVHARGQVANFKTHTNVTPQDIIQYCHQYLPSDITVYGAQVVDDHFHARYHAKGKQYIYQIDNGMIHDVFERKYRYHIPQPLDINQMKKASSYLIGEHDFRSFTNLKSKKKSTVRTISKIDFIQRNTFLDISFEGNGFLYNMVRIITGTLIEVGLGKMLPEDVKTILDKKERPLAGPNIPPHGLFLQKVIY
ncbi:MAG: tRNA pseudouridine synthase [Defluviitaleaceae bacterium]|jgi:tRNA pseudouridine38-40 synthase|uniref:tRNA pseudouridine synthase A n=1 Tax=Defluviitalea raffinosedens TaxID=1450156 RepID=A0A7C8HEA7_9FIRM|nr:tRNA pseudouridine(38-40) synthase TruA [Defluviitalea raffinosedens]KAE9633769.1 tRNA pseudouridine(38-40) synthase TruA [Defluviitalea raffinosedens]MBZ4668046.1 tRNA pseudouridine synthase [Defluviitaleaceae bacterium]